MSVPAGARVEVSADGATAGEIRIHGGSGGALIREGSQVTRHGGQLPGSPTPEPSPSPASRSTPGETTEAGPPWPSGNFAAAKDMGSWPPLFTAEIARTLGDRYEPA